MINSKMMAAGLLVLGLVASGHATTYRWTWAGNGPVSHAAGQIQDVRAEYNSTTGDLYYETTIGYRPGSTSLPEGFWMAINNGPNPKGVAGELALFYFDASGSSPVLTAYGYNGLNNGTTWQDGSEAAGLQAPDRIASSLASSSWLNAPLQVVNNGTSRTFKMSVKGSVINAHTPLYPDVDPWKGAQFDTRLGLWMHTLDGLNTSYAPDGFLHSFSRNYEGYLDLTNETTEVVPEPFTIAALGAGLLALARRRK